MDKHDHSHHGHDHASFHATPVSADSSRRVFWAMILTGGFMLAEVAGGLYSGSLALLSDAGHMLTDFLSLALAWIAFRAGERRPDARRTYGYHRFQVLAAFVNGLALFLVVGWIAWEAVDRFREPVEVLAAPMLVIASLGLVVNGIVFRILHGGDRDNLNMRGAMLHVLGDLLGSVAAIAAALVILYTGWTPIDPLLSVFVGMLILRSAWDVVRRSGHILLEGAPEDIDRGGVAEHLKSALSEVIDVHHVHLWSLTTAQTIITLHVIVDASADHDTILAAIHDQLREAFGIEHATVQIEHGQCVEAE